MIHIYKWFSLFLLLYSFADKIVQTDPVIPQSPAVIKQGAIEEDCTDFQGKTIKHGLLYVPGPAVCTMCVCYHSEPMWCKAIYCDPPYFCNKFRVGERCCEFICLDPPGDAAAKLLEKYRERFKSNVSVRQASSIFTVTSIVTFSLLMVL